MDARPTMHANDCRDGIIPPKGVLLLASCNTRATREDPRASSRKSIPKLKIVVTAGLQLETYQLSH